MVRRRFDGLLGAMVRHRGKAGALADAIGRFRKVARSYRPGLFHCYAVPGLPRDPQRPRAMVRRATPSRPARDRAQDGLARHRAARRGATDRRGRNADQTTNSGRPGPGRSNGVGRHAPASRPKAPRSDAPHSVSPRPGRLPRHLGTTSMPANFAVLGKTRLQDVCDQLLARFCDMGLLHDRRLVARVRSNIDPPSPDHCSNRRCLAIDGYTATTHSGKPSHPPKSSHNCSIINSELLY